MHQDFKDLLSAFNAHGVKYLIIGGYAVSLHAQPRATKDIDIFIKADLTNAKSVYAALADFGAPVESVEIDDLADSSSFIRFGQEPMAVDIHPAIPGVAFDTAWENRVEAIIEPQSGVKAFFISRADLVASKLASGRARDLADVEEIRAAENNCKQ
ncbi:MAG TPA: DUF6036 family nucleotidyltransferase [Terriglobia bacterium]|nr:DUF6036 family nucleotidyltransferase [Terriglobia bacterium]